MIPLRRTIGAFVRLCSKHKTEHLLTQTTATALHAWCCSAETPPAWPACGSLRAWSSRLMPLCLHWCMVIKGISTELCSCMCPQLGSACTCSRCIASGLTGTSPAASGLSLCTCCWSCTTNNKCRLSSHQPNKCCSPKWPSRELRLCRIGSD